MSSSDQDIAVFPQQDLPSELKNQNLQATLDSRRRNPKIADLHGQTPFLPYSRSLSLSQILVKRSTTEVIGTEFTRAQYGRRAQSRCDGTDDAQGAIGAVGWMWRGGTCVTPGWMCAWGCSLSRSERLAAALWSLPWAASSCAAAKGPHSYLLQPGTASPRPLLSHAIVAVRMAAHLIQTSPAPQASGRRGFTVSCDHLFHNCVFQENLQISRNVIFFLFSYVTAFSFPDCTNNPGWEGCRTE